MKKIKTEALSLMVSKFQEVYDNYDNASYQMPKLPNGMSFKEAFSKLDVLNTLEWIKHRHRRRMWGLD